MLCFPQKQGNSELIKLLSLKGLNCAFKREEKERSFLLHSQPPRGKEFGLWRRTSLMARVAVHPTVRHLFAVPPPPLPPPPPCLSNTPSIPYSNPNQCPQPTPLLVHLDFPKPKGILSSWGFEKPSCGESLLLPASSAKKNSRRLQYCSRIFFGLPVHK